MGVVIFLLKTILLFVKLFHLGIIPGQNFNPQIVGFEKSTKQVGFQKYFNYVFCDKSNFHVYPLFIFFENFLMTSSFYMNFINYQRRLIFTEKVKGWY